MSERPDNVDGEEPELDVEPETEPESGTEPEPEPQPKPVAKKRKPRKRYWVAAIAAFAVLVGYGITQLDNPPAIPNVLPGKKTTTPAPPPDTDGDGLPDEVEVAGWATASGEVYKTDPAAADTDSDGLTDGDEAGEIDPESDPEAPVYLAISNPRKADSDGDGLDDAAEADLSLDPFDKDTDQDQISDGREVLELGTAPDVADTDGDGFKDGYEDKRRETQELDPLWADSEVDKNSYAYDYAIGAVAGDMWRRDSMAWLAGNLTSGAASLIPVGGSIIGAITDTRDAIGSAIQADWVGSGFSVVGAIPGGDIVAIPGKAGKFVARNPQLAPLVAAMVAGLHKVPTNVRFNAVQAATPGANDLIDLGASKKGLIGLAEGRTNLDELAAATKRSSHTPGTATKPLPTAKSNLKPGPAGELALEKEMRKTGSNVSTQVVLSTKSCPEICNSGHRRVDVLVDGVAHESKVGHVPWSESIERQIRSDAYLTKSGDLRGAHWHFYPSSVSNTLGADPKVTKLLDELNIPFTVHPPK